MKMKKGSYNSYLQSSAWRDKRNMIMDHWDNRCAVCYSDEKVQLHHRTYDRVGHEKMTDLVPLCKRCHEYFTFRETYTGAYISLMDAIDYSPNAKTKTRGDNIEKQVVGGMQLRAECFQLASKLKDYITLEDIDNFNRISKIIEHWNKAVENA